MRFVLPHNRTLTDGIFLTRGEALLHGLPPGLSALSGKYPLTPPTAKLRTKKNCEQERTFVLLNSTWKRYENKMSYSKFHKIQYLHSFFIISSRAEILNMKYDLLEELITRYGTRLQTSRLAAGRTVQGSNPGGCEIFRTRPDRVLPPRLLYNGSYPEIKRPGCDVDHLTQRLKKE